MIRPEAAGEIHILFFDIEDDGIPAPGDRSASLASSSA